jgi:hypothetical protein
VGILAEFRLEFDIDSSLFFAKEQKLKELFCMHSNCLYITHQSQLPNHARKLREFK